MKSYLKDNWYRIEESYLNKEATQKKIKTKVESNPNKEKVIEYRDITPYWSKRLEGRHYDLIQFRNGYAKVAPVMIVEFKGMYTSGQEYAIVLGKILETKNVT